MSFGSRANICALILCLAAIAVAAEEQTKQLIKEYVSVEDSCANGLNFGSVREFMKFFEAYKQLEEEQLRALKVHKRCVKDRQAILELGDVLVTDMVCDPMKIDEFIDYHKKHIGSQPSAFSSLFTDSSKPITRLFFRKYAIQVAHICKRNLAKNMAEAREELKARSKVFEEARDRVYNDEPSIKSNIKLIEEQPDYPPSVNVKPRDDTELALSEYREALTRLRRPEDILVFDRDECLKSKTRETLVSSDKLNTFFKPALMCHQLHRHYAGSVLSIARLANHGYVAVDEELDNKIADDASLRDWIIAAQVCEPMLYMAAAQKAKPRDDGMTVVDTCAEKVSAIELSVYEDNFDDFDEAALEEMLPRSKPTRESAQKIMNSALKKMAKMDLMRQLRKSGSSNKRSIFSKSLSVLKSYTSGSSGAQDQLSARQQRNPSSLNTFSIQLSGELQKAVGPLDDAFVEPQLSDKQAYELLMTSLVEKPERSSSSNGELAPQDNGIDQAVAYFDPVSSLLTTLIVLAIMLTFEWIFFVVMTLAARLCHHLYFNFENLLTFPPKFLSWSDADFARFSDKVEQIDEDDFYDYDELTHDERQQRDLLSKVFGRPPPMLYRD